MPDHIPNGPPRGTTANRNRLHAARLVRHIRRRVLAVPGRRAGVRAARAHEPGDPRTFAAYREIARFLPEQADPETERAFLTVAAMQCAQSLPARTNDSNQDPIPDDGSGQPAETDATATSDPLSTDKERSLGASAALAVHYGVLRESTMESRLHALCRMNASTIHRQVPQLVAHLRGANVPIDWASLIVDLAAWDRSRRRLTATWLREFYRVLVTTPDSTDEQPEEQESA